MSVVGRGIVVALLLCVAAVLTGWGLFFLFAVIAVVAALLFSSPSDSKTPAVDSGTSDQRLMKRCPDCAESVQLDARICRFCHFNFDTGIGADGEARSIEGSATEIAPRPRPVAIEMAWAQLERGHVKFALDQAFVALKSADNPGALSDLAALAAALRERTPPGRNRTRADELARRVEQERTRIRDVLDTRPAG